jgi:hypothetical protein
MPVAYQTPVPAVAPPAPVPQAAIAGQSIDALRTQLGDMNVQLAGLRAQWNGLQDQLNSMLKSNPSRPAVVAKWSDVGVQIAQVEGDVARVKAQIALKQGVPVVGVPAPPGTRSGPDPDMITEMSFVLLLVIFIPSSIAYARRIWRGKPAPQPRDSRDDVSPKRMERMEQAIDAIAIEIERVSEGQRFVTKVLADRMPASSSAAEKSAAPMAGSAPALGAGPIEPVLGSDREAVRLSSRAERGI